MTDRFIDTIRTHCKPLAPRATGVAPKLRSLGKIRAVLFDVYGTMMISASGDIGSDAGDHQLRSLREAIDCFHIELNRRPAQAVQTFEEAIRHDHTLAMADGIQYPEVNIVQVWQEVLAKIVTEQPENLDVERFALEYEVRVNPVWPMPEVAKTAHELKKAGLVLGIVSNAQFFTPLLFPALLRTTLAELGFSRGLSYFSYEHGQAKPGQFLYKLAKEQLANQGIQAREVLYVGNDMLNDVAAAAAVGFRTALFAGDQRSLRLRAHDERTRDVEADIVVTALPQLMDCVTNCNADELVSE